ncbi:MULTISPECIES: DUF3139 domain-containing protein [Bacillaceae]|uniref:DUF3139 domain-containing protein n=2 Tax=Bacillales TaxID=1385 RepID=UPI0002DDDD12|nr:MULTISPECIES: DUF3139 domain-containing protein [Bacillaceae]MCT1542103.1 DUF3139 domain-containing protein [Lysinibacillus capsici]MCT1573325.1 DUF3139 domain-containing protein [Lysinibacillus capsici]MCT1650342.1 DUF3139 domain-containing protein [Lysinibacillus capsici]MCT1728733.1 DUF3139 domain-containing protein [Lysinibacillus capsici]MCT1786553.1 DUF3139 domain-containing protein [Lysinibacillus capsici]
MKKSIIFPSILILIILVLFSTIEIFNFYGNEKADDIDKGVALELEKDVLNYLSSKGYKEDEIYKIEVKYNPKIGNVPDAYYVNVIFLDEKDVTYKYVVINGDIVQSGLSGSSGKGKHEE